MPGMLASGENNPQISFVAQDIGAMSSKGRVLTKRSSGDLSHGRETRRRTIAVTKMSTPTRARRTAAPAVVTPEPAASPQHDTVLAVLSVPPRFSLSQAICSYGYFGLAPNTWQPADLNEANDDAGIFERPLVFGSPNHEEHAALVRVEQIAKNQVRITIIGGSMPSNQIERDQLLNQVRRITRLDWCPQEFWDMHPEAKARGYGRTYRSPTLWEDMVKTLTNCNMQWSGTVQMNRQLCSELGHVCQGTDRAAFPTAQQVMNAGADRLKQCCRVGYRAPWIAELAAKFVNGELDASSIEDYSVSDDQLFRTLTSLKGFGKFASSNVMQLLGRHSVYPLDTETTRLFREVHGVPKSVPVARVHQQARDHYEKYAPYQFLAYWFDLWRNYEERKCQLSPRWKVETCLSL